MIFELMKGEGGGKVCFVDDDRRNADDVRRGCEGVEVVEIGRGQGMGEAEVAFIDAWTRR